MASRSLLFKWCGYNSRIFAPSQSTLCPSSHVCTATPFFQSLSLLHICYPFILVTCQSLQCRLDHNPGMESDIQLPSCSLEVFKFIKRCLRVSLDSNFCSVPLKFCGAFGQPHPFLRLHPHTHNAFVQHAH